MSELTLYRIDDESVYWPIIQQELNLGRLKRVYVDYEMAQIVLSEILDAMGISASINAGMVVDAALGITDPMKGWAVDE